MHSDYRHDPFTDASTATTITGEVQMIPAGSPYTIRLNEVPLKETPSSIVMRIRDVLTAAIATAGATSCTVMNGSWFAINDVITIDNEQMLVTNVVSNTLTITRGYNSTTAATHSANIAVYGPTWSEVAATPAARQYWPDYGTGADNDDMWNTGTVQFNSADAGKILDIAYKGTGTLAGVNPAKSWPACYSEYGDGSDGHFISSGSDTIDGLKQYKSFVVQAGHTVTVGANPLLLLSHGVVVIAGTINGAGANGATASATAAGGAGKGGGGSGGTYSANTGASTGANGGSASGAGGGSAYARETGFVGGSGSLEGVSINPGSSVPAAVTGLSARRLSVSAGGGGAAGPQNGMYSTQAAGGGAGSVVLVGRKVINTGTITATGGAVGANQANVSGGGGGGGAAVRVVAPLIKLAGTITVNGGNGGNGTTNSATVTAGAAGWSKVIEIGG